MAMNPRIRRLATAATFGFLLALAQAGGAHAVDAQQTVKEAAGSTGAQPGGQPAEPKQSVAPPAGPAGTTAGAAGGQVTRGGCQEGAAAGPGADRSGEVGQPVPPPGC